MQEAQKEHSCTIQKGKLEVLSSVRSAFFKLHAMANPQPSLLGVTLKPGAARQRRLGLKGNLLRELPESIGGLASLAELFITDNRLESLPAAMGHLTALVKLQARSLESCLYILISLYIKTNTILNNLTMLEFPPTKIKPPLLTKFTLHHVNVAPSYLAQTQLFFTLGMF